MDHPETRGREVLHVPAGDGIALWVPEEPPPDLVDGEGPEMSTYTFVATAESTGGALAVVDTVVPGGNGPPEHVHADADESFFMLDGELEVEAGGKAFTLRAGDYAFVPRGSRHIWKNRTAAVSRLIRIYTPGGHERFFMEISRPAASGVAAPRLTTDDVRRAEAAVAKYYGPAAVPGGHAWPSPTAPEKGGPVFVTPTIVLVHGGWHGAWCWSGVERALRRRGLDVVSVELTSTGDDAGAVGDLRTDAAEVRAVVRRVGGPVVLVGHSYGGLVVTEAAGELDSVSAIVYVAAFMPDVGDSMTTLTGGGRAPWIHLSEDGLLSIAQGWGARLFYSDCDERVALEAENRLRPQSLASFTQAVQAASWRRIHSTYVVCRQDKAISPEAQRRWGALLDECIEIDSGHSPFLSQPETLADLLQQRAQAESAVSVR